jgi:hypothetical protein
VKIQKNYYLILDIGYYYYLMEYMAYKKLFLNLRNLSTFHNKLDNIPEGKDSGD